MRLKFIACKYTNFIQKQKDVLISFYFSFTAISFKSSTAFKVLVYFPERTGVLPRKYWSTAKEVLAGDENHLGK